MCPGYIWCHLTRAVELVFRNNDVDDEQDMLIELLQRHSDIKVANAAGINHIAATSIAKLKARGTPMCEIKLLELHSSSSCSCCSVSVRLNFQL